MLSTNLPFNFTGDTAFRLLSIDGGHLAATAFSDLVWAAHSLVKGGIIMVDDFWHSDWIGVTEACYSYMNCASTAGYPELFPFFWGGSKLYFTNSKDHYELYYSAILKDGMWGKTVESKMKRWTPRSCDKCAGKGAQKQHPNITLGPHNTAILRSLLAAKGNSATESAWIRLVGVKLTNKSSSSPEQPEQSYDKPEKNTAGTWYELKLRDGTSSADIG